MSSAPPVTTVRLTIDGKEIAVPKGTTIYTAATHAGIDIPTFCYHDRMEPLGACRVCLVEVEKMPKLVTSCTQEAGDGMVVYTVSEKAKAGQHAILEFLLINHPLDCPICDKGGECPLQDNTLKFGPGQSRFVEVKRTYRKHLRMGPTLVLDRERCILCWRCVRFGEIVAGDDALQGFERGYHNQIATPRMAPVESKFIGNTIEICPVGALTSATYRFRSRPWDNRAVESICPHCGCGCATTLNVRGNDLDRTRSREHREVNDVWLCDKGFFGYEFVQSPDRLTTPLVRADGVLREATWAEALDRVAGAVGGTPSDAIGVLGGARSTNEDNYLLLRLFRGIIGTNSIDFRTETAHPMPGTWAAWGLPCSIAEVETADTIVLVGCDLTEEYPIVWLRVKKAVDRGARLVVLSAWELEIARWATHGLTHRAGTEQVLLGALAGRHDVAWAAAASEAPADRLRDAARALAQATRPLVLLGRAALERPDAPGVLAAVQALRAAFPATRVGLLRGRANSGGAQILGLVPDMLPGYRSIADPDARAAVETVWGRPVPRIPGRTTRGMLEAARSGDLGLLYVVGADPATDYPDVRAWQEARRGVGVLVVHDLFLTRTAAAADVVLPVLAYAEKTGTVGNIEGRVQRQDAAVRGPGIARSDGEIFSAIAERLGAELAFASWEGVFAEIARLVPGWKENARVAPPELAPELAGTAASGASPAARATNGAFTLVVGTRLYDRGTMAVRCPGIRGQAGAPFVGLHPDDAGRLGLGEGMMCDVRSPHAVLRLPVRLLPGLHPGHAYVPRGYDSAPASVLQDERGPVMVTLHLVGGGA